MSYNPYKTDWSVYVKLFFFFLVVAAVVCGTFYLEYGTVDQITITVNNKERITESDGDGGTSSRYLVFTDKGEFEVTDSLFHLKFRASSTYSKLEEDGTYRVKVNGKRIGLLSMYPNILEVNPPEEASNAG